MSQHTFTVEPNDNNQAFFVTNDFTGKVHGTFKTKGEAELFAAQEARRYESAHSMVSGRLTPPKEMPTE